MFVFTGDGAFGLSAIELDTAARHGLGVVIVVVNNGGWGDVRHEQRMFYGEEADQGAELRRCATTCSRKRSAATASASPSRPRCAPRSSARARRRRTGVPAIVDAVTDPDVMSDLMRNLGGLTVM